MNRIKFRYIFFSITTAMFAAAACEKNELRSTETFLPTDKAFVKLGMFSIGSPSVNIKVNDQKLNGVVISAAGSVFPPTTTSPDYVAVAPNGQLKLSVPNAGTTNDSIVIITAPLALTNNSFFTVVLADTGVNRTVFTVSDIVSIADSGFIKYRVINAIPNATINLIRIDSASPASVVRDTIARNVAYKSSSDFLNIPLPASGSPSIRFRIATTTGLNLFTSNPGLTNKRAITQYATGFAGGTGAFVPSLGNLIINK